MYKVGEAGFLGDLWAHNRARKIHLKPDAFQCTDLNLIVCTLQPIRIVVVQGIKLRILTNRKVKMRYKKYKHRC